MWFDNEIVAKNTRILRKEQVSHTRANCYELENLKLLNV